MTCHPHKPRSPGMATKWYGRSFGGFIDVIMPRWGQHSRCICACRRQFFRTGADCIPSLSSPWSSCQERSQAMAASQPREPLFRASGSRQVIFPAALRRRVNFLRGLDFAVPAPRRCCRRGAAALREGTHSSPSRPSRGEDGIFVGHNTRKLEGHNNGTRPATHASCALPAQSLCYQDFTSMAANPDY